MSIQEAQVLQDLIWLVRALTDRVTALEERWPTWAGGNVPHADIAARLALLDRAAAAINGNAPAIATDPGELVRRIEALEALHDANSPAPVNAQPAAIADTLETELVADEISRGLCGAGEAGMTRSQISGALFGRHESAERIAAALEQLKSKGLAVSSRRPGAGRSTEVWYAPNCERSELSERRGAP